MFYDGTIYEELAHNIIKDWAFWTSITACSFWFFALMKTIILSRVKYNKDGEKVIRVYKCIAAFSLITACVFWYMFNMLVAYSYFAMIGKNGANYFNFICLIIQSLATLFVCSILAIGAFAHIVYITNKRAGRFNFWPFKWSKKDITNIIMRRLAYLLKTNEILFKDAGCEEDRNIIIGVYVQIYEKKNKNNAVDITVPMWKVKKIEELIRKEQEND